MLSYKQLSEIEAIGARPKNTKRTKGLSKMDNIQKFKIKHQLNLRWSTTISKEFLVFKGPLRWPI